MHVIFNEWAGHWIDFIHFWSMIFCKFKLGLFEIVVITRTEFVLILESVVSLIDLTFRVICVSSGIDHRDIQKKRRIQQTLHQQKKWPANWVKTHISGHHFNLAKVSRLRSMIHCERNSSRPCQREYSSNQSTKNIGIRETSTLCYWNHSFHLSTSSPKIDFPAGN